MQNLAKIKKSWLFLSFLEKRQNLSATFETKGSFLWKYLDDMRFWQARKYLFLRKYLFSRKFTRKYVYNKSHCAISEKIYFAKFRVFWQKWKRHFRFNPFLKSHKMLKKRKILIAHHESFWKAVSAPSAWEDEININERKCRLLWKEEYAHCWA